MKYFKYLILFSILFINPVLADSQGGLAEYWPGRVIVKFREETQTRNLIRDHFNAKFVKALPSINGEVWEVANVGAAIATKHADIEHIQPDYVIRSNPPGSMGSGSYDLRRGIRDIEPLIVEPKVPVLCAVLDSGVDYNHPDLKSYIWTNPEEIPNNGIDDDQNGYIDDVHGYDFVDNDGDPMDDCNDSHGTHVAGIMAGIKNEDNKENINVVTTGIGLPAKIIALKILKPSITPFGTEECVGSFSNAIAALEYVQINASKMGIKCTNNSWGGSYEFNQDLADTIEEEEEAGRLFITAAGNEFREDNDLRPHYPASYEFNNIITVCSVGHDNRLSGFSNFGKNSVDLCALGERVKSMITDNRFGIHSGTAMATPHVTNAITLIWSAFPHLTATEVKSYIMNSVDTIPELIGINKSGGRLNLRNAIASVELPIDPKPIIELSTNQGIVPFTVNANANNSLGKFLNYEWMSSDGQEKSGLAVDFTFDIPDTYVITLKATDENDASATTQKAIEAKDNQPPVALFSILKSQGFVPLEIIVDASESYDNETSISTYKWNSSTRQESFGQETFFTFKTPGEHTITLTVSDSHGATNTIVQNITVEELMPDISISLITENIPIDTFDAIWCKDWFEISNIKTRRKVRVSTPSFLLREIGLSLITEYCEYQSEQIIPPNDPDFIKTWSLNNTGQIKGKKGADINALKAWKTTTGEEVVCAVLDSGIDIEHPDLKDNLWINQQEFNGKPNIDDDENGFVDDIHGWNFISDSKDIYDECGHGTQVAGIIGAKGNNGKGVTGVNWSAKLMALKVARHDPVSGECNSSNEAIADALKYAHEMGVKCYNLSLGGSSYDEKLLDTIKTIDDGILVTAAGNDFLNNNTENPYFPASYDSDNIISVCATDNEDELAFFSNVGRTTVDLCAPGNRIISTFPNGNYREDDGTSMSTAYVSGAVTLLWSQFPNLTNTEIKKYILESAKVLPSLRNTNLTSGRLDIYKAFELVKSQYQIFNISNTGKSDLQIKQIRLTGKNKNEFILRSYDNCLSDSLAVGKKCTVDISLNPTSSGHKQAILEIISNAPQVATVTIEMNSDNDISTGDPKDNNTTANNELPFESSETATYHLDSKKLEIPTVIADTKELTNIFQVELCPVDNKPLSFKLCSEPKFIKTRHKILGDTTYDLTTYDVNIPGIEVGVDSGIFYEVDMKILSNQDGHLEFKVIKTIQIH